MNSARGTATPAFDTTATVSAIPREKMTLDDAVDLILHGTGIGVDEDGDEHGRN